MQSLFNLNSKYLYRNYNMVTHRMIIRWKIRFEEISAQEFCLKDKKIKSVIQTHLKTIFYSNLRQSQLLFRQEFLLAFFICYCQEKSWYLSADKGQTYLHSASPIFKKSSASIFEYSKWRMWKQRRFEKPLLIIV